MGKGPAGILADIAYARYDTCISYENFIVGKALFGEKSLEVLVDGGEKALEVVSVGVVVAIVKPKILDGVRIGRRGAKHGDGGAVSPVGESVNKKGGLCGLKGVFVSPLKIKRT